MTDDTITAGQLRLCGYYIADDIPDHAFIKKGSLLISQCDMDYDDNTGIVRGSLDFVITEAFTWEPPVTPRITDTPEVVLPCSPDCRGLGVFSADFDPPEEWVHIERCDHCGTYPDDLAAARTISRTARYWCVRCGVFGDHCTSARKHSWRVVVPEQDAKEAGLLPKEDNEDI